MIKEDRHAHGVEAPPGSEEDGRDLEVFDNPLDNFVDSPPSASGHGHGIDAYHEESEDEESSSPTTGEEIF